MAVAYVGSTLSVRTATTDPYTFSHTVGATAKGLVLTAAHGTESTDLIVSADIAGVAFTRIASVSVTAGDEPGRSYIYFVGSGLPAAGARTVTVDMTSATGTDVMFTVQEFTGNNDLYLIDWKTFSGVAANPAVILDDRDQLITTAGMLYSGSDGLPAVGTGLTSTQTNDFGAFTARVARQTTPAIGDFTFSYTIASDDMALVAIAIADTRYLDAGLGRANPYQFQPWLAQ